jgi:hypothetical protein
VGPCAVIFTFIIEWKQEKEVSIYSKPSIAITIKRKEPTVILPHVGSTFEHGHESCVIVKRGDLRPSTFKQRDDFDFLMKMRVFLESQGIEYVQPFIQPGNSGTTKKRWDTPGFTDTPGPSVSGRIHRSDH